MPAVRAAVAVILAEAPGNSPAILFIRRAADPRDPWSGQIALPGGRREETDADAVATAIRETREETGLRLKRENATGIISDVRPMGKDLPPVIIRPVLFSIPRKRTARRSAEAPAAFWISADALREGRGRSAVVVRGTAMRVESYRVGRRVIWGATYRILESYFRLKRS